MAQTKKLDKINKEKVDLQEKDVLLTEEEYARKSRQKTKDSMNRVLRVVGLISSFLLIYIGLFDAMFELSYFGLIFDKESHNIIWEILSGNYGRDLVDAAPALGTLIENPIFDDPLRFYSWLPKLMFTIVLILAVIGTIYLAVYNIVDIIAMIKSFLRSGLDVASDLTGTVRDSVREDMEKDKKERRKSVSSLFAKNKDVEDEFTVPGDQVEETPKKENKKPKRRKEKKEDFGGLTSEEMDILLNGGSLEDLNQPEEQLPVEETPVSEKSLFDD